MMPREELEKRLEALENDMDKLIGIRREEQELLGNFQKDFFKLRDDLLLGYPKSKE